MTLYGDLFIFSAQKANTTSSKRNIMKSYAPFERLEKRPTIGSIFIVILRRPARQIILVIFLFISYFNGNFRCIYNGYINYTPVFTRVISQYS